MQHDSGLEYKVGVFVLIALAFIASLVVIFGRFSESFAKTYDLTIVFQNAEGLLKGAEVDLAGAPIGRVSTPPVPLPDGGVSVKIRIRQTAQIREGSKFRITSLGLMGDRNIEIEPNTDTAQKLITDGETITTVTRNPGLDTLTAEAQPVIQEIHEIAAKINTQILTDETTADTRETIKQMKASMTRLNVILSEVQAGRGSMGKLFKDPKTAENLSVFIANLRAHGVFFYADTEGNKDEDKRTTSNPR